MKQVKVALAPMAGVTDSSFRLMNRLGGADYAYSEMIHARALTEGNGKTIKLAAFSPYEQPYILQLFGNDPKYFGQAARIISKGLLVINYSPLKRKEREIIEYFCKKIPDKKVIEQFLDNLKRWGKAVQKQSNKKIIPYGIDINLGCPARRVVGHGGGAALCKDPKLVRKILQEVLKNTRLPVSVKVRTEVYNTPVTEVLDKMKDLKLHHVMVHGRSLKQGFSGAVDTEEIKKIRKRYPQWEIWANGGIVDVKSALKMQKETGCTTLGIARGSYGNPLLANMIKEGIEMKALTAVNSCLAYIHTLLMFQVKKDKGMQEMRKHLAWYIKDFPNAKSWRARLVRVESVQQAADILKEIVNG